MSALGLIRKGNIMFWIDLNLSGLAAVPQDCHRWEGVPVLGFLLWPVLGSPGLHQSLLPSVGMGTSTGDSSSLVSRRLVGGGGVALSSPPSSRSPSVVVPRPGDRH